MPRNISCALTTQQVRDRTKTVTRRSGWRFVKAGDVLHLVEKTRVTPLVTIATVRVIDARREPLSAITDEDVIREGFPQWTARQFIDFYRKTFHVPEDEEVTRIEWAYLDPTAQDNPVKNLPAPRASAPHDKRARLIRLLHVGKRELGMADDAYRDILASLCGQRSARDLSVAQLERVLAHLKECGFKITKKKTKRTSRALARDPESRKARALWLFLHELGVVRDPSERALAAYVKRMTGIDALQWLNGQEEWKVIESLKKWAMRRLPEQVAERVRHMAAQPLSDADRKKLAGIQGLLFGGISAFDPLWGIWETLDEMERSGQPEHANHRPE
uniref:Mu-like prophage protein gp16 n=1 Tax=Candidatus Kentrum sp. LPFa TaxID=2126335 RepID=A0A450WDA0_9GAMM|nr:MAG: Mu-like prophage protein gp16 [Candidatus Kentron sp. LPFa]